MRLEQLASGAGAETLRERPLVVKMWWRVGCRKLDKPRSSVQEDPECGRKTECMQELWVGVAQDLSWRACRTDGIVCRHTGENSSEVKVRACEAGGFGWTPFFWAISVRVSTDLCRGRSVQHRHRVFVPIPFHAPLRRRHFPIRAHLPHWEPAVDVNTQE